LELFAVKKKYLSYVFVGLLSLIQTLEAKRKLNVYNWVDFISKDVIKDFEKETGIEVNYDVYDSNEVLETKLYSGNSGYDLVVPPLNPVLSNHIKAGFYQKIDKSKLKNYKNLDPQLLQQLKSHDPELLYSIPYLWGTSGIGFNREKIKKVIDNPPVDSLKIIFDPKYAQKLQKCGAVILDSPSDIFPLVLNYLKRPPNSFDLKDLALAEKLLRDIRPYVRFISPASYIGELASADICLAVGWSGDIYQAREKARLAKNKVVVEYSHPQEGSSMWMDVMAIPQGAPHPEEAHLFIDFILRAKSGAQITNDVGYATGNLAAKPLLPENILNEPMIYPPEEVTKRLYVELAPPHRYERKRVRTWIKIKARRQ
jgi:putrescine transport system substrate-binding protein